MVIVAVTEKHSIGKDETELEVEVKEDPGPAKIWNDRLAGQPGCRSGDLTLFSLDVKKEISHAIIP